MMRTIKLNLSDSIDLKNYDLSMIIASKLYQDAKIFVDHAAKMISLSKRAFIEMLGKYEVSIFSTSITDLYSDIKNA